MGLCGTFSHIYLVYLVFGEDIFNENAHTFWHVKGF